MYTLTVHKLYLRYDMRSGVHEISDNAQRTLKPDQANLYINRRATIARLVDHMGGVHTYWTTPSNPFNENLIVELFDSAIGLTLNHVDFTTATNRRTRRTRAAA